MPNFHLTAKSKNAKTGPIPVSTSSRDTCPAVCLFRSNGCYAAAGKLKLHWDKVSEGSRGVTWQKFLASVAGIKPGQLWRHNQAGDLFKPGTKGGRVALEELTKANQGRRGFTYSHHKRTASTVQAFKAATAHGFNEHSA